MFSTPFNTKQSFGDSNFSTQYGLFSRASLGNIQKSIKKEKKEILSLIGVGDSIFDIISEVNMEIIKKYGLENNKTIYTNQNSMKLFDEINKMPIVRYTPGGSSQNILRVLSCRLNNNNKKYKISMLGCVGEDEYKYKIYNSLIDCGVNPILEISKNEKTSKCAVCICNKKTYYVAYIAASKNLDEQFITNKLKEILDHEALLIDGYSLQYQFNICKNLCESFYRDKKLTILTLNNEYIIKYYNERIIEIANISDIIFGNMQQAEEFSELKGVEIKMIFEKIFKKLRPKDRLLVINGGLDGAYCSKFNYKENNLEFILQYFSPKINSDEIIDRTGYEDAFLGGFLSEYMKGNSLYECLKMGNETANVILHNYGCTFAKNFEFKTFQI